MGGFYEKPNKFISTLLVGNNIALASFTLLFEIFLDGSMPIAEGGFKLLIYTLISTVIVLIFGEFLPKTIFKHLADQAVYALAIPLRVIQGVLFLPSFMMSHCSNIILKYVLRTPIENVEYQITKMDLGHFIKNSSKESDDEINTDTFEKALHLEEQRVKKSKMNMIKRSTSKRKSVSMSLSFRVD